MASEVLILKSCVDTSVQMFGLHLAYRKVEGGIYL